MYDRVDVDFNADQEQHAVNVVVGDSHVQVVSSFVVKLCVCQKNCMFKILDLMNVQKELLGTFVLNKELSNKQQTNSSKHKGRHLLNVSGNIIDLIFMEEISIILYNECINVHM